MLIVRNAIIRRLGPGRLPDPIPARLPLFGPETLGRLVTLEAVLEDGEARENGYVLNLPPGRRGSWRRCCTTPRRTV